MPARVAPAHPSPTAAELRERLRLALISGMGELDLNHSDVAEACGATRQNVSLWASPHHEGSPALAYVAALASSQDERLRTLGLRLLREAAAGAEADLVDLRAADEGDPLARVMHLDRESFEARASIVSAHADGHLTSDELAAIVRENDQASTAHRLEANSARLELARRRQRPSQ